MADPRHFEELRQKYTPSKTLNTHGILLKAGSGANLARLAMATVMGLSELPAHCGVGEWLRESKTDGVGRPTGGDLAELRRKGLDGEMQERPPCRLVGVSLQEAAEG